jgi:hypothetical protein
VFITDGDEKLFGKDQPFDRPAFLLAAGKAWAPADYTCNKDGVAKGDFVVTVPMLAMIAFKVSVIKTLCTLLVSWPT